MARKKRKRKVPARVVLSRLHKKADRALSEYVRAVTVAEFAGKCPLCGVGEIQCCFHFVRRKRKILRWDLRNVVGACHKCNWIEYRDPDLSRAWYLKRHGLEQYLTIVEKSKEFFAPTPEYLQGIIDRFTTELDCMKSFLEPTVPASDLAKAVDQPKA